MRFISRKGKSSVLCVGPVGKDIFLPTDAGVISKTPIDSQSQICTPKMWSFGYGDKVHIEDRFISPGGCACNVSVGLARLGVSVGAYGTAADDSDGRWVKSELQKNNVDVSKLTLVKTIDSVGGENQAHTDMSMILVAKDRGERTIFVSRDVGEHFVPKNQEMQGHEYLYLGSLYGSKVADIMKRIHDMISANETRLMYNPGMKNLTHNPREVLDLIAHTTILFVNRVEAETIVCAANPDYNIVKEKGSGPENSHIYECGLLEELSLLTNGSGTIVMTAGDAGAWVATPKCTNITHVSTLSAKALDTTGAGDAFTSAYIAATLQGLDPQVGLRWGASNSHNVIGYYGGQEGLLTQDTIELEAQKFVTQKVG